MKRLIWIVAGLVLIGVIVVALLPKPIPVETSTIARGPLVVTIDGEGKARVHDRFTVSASVTGELERIEFQEGDMVTRGETVAMLLPPPLDPTQREELEERIRAAEANVRTTQAMAARVEASLEQARRESARLAGLEREGAIAHQDVERSANAVAVAERELASARAQIDAAKAQADAVRAARGAYTGTRRVPIPSPATGRVLALLEKNRRVVPAGTPIMQVGDPNGLEIVVDLLSADAVNVQSAMRVLIEGWGGDNALKGRVLRVEPSAFTKVSALGIEEQRVNVVIALVESAPRLGDGFRVDARIVLWEDENVLKVPLSAIFRETEGWALFVIRDGVAHRQSVKIGHRNSTEAEVIEGLREGDVVVVHPSDAVTDGVDVEVTDGEG